MNVAKLLYDPKCYELAEYFLPDGADERLKNSLAYEIQCSVEEWIEENETVDDAALPSLDDVRGILKT